MPLFSKAHLLNKHLWGGNLGCMWGQSWENGKKFFRFDGGGGYPSIDSMLANVWSQEKKMSLSGSFGPPTLSCSHHDFTFDLLFKPLLCRCNFLWTQICQNRCGFLTCQHKNLDNHWWSQFFFFLCNCLVCSSQVENNSTFSKHISQSKA